MQKQTPPEATKAVYPILRQTVNLIPPNIFHAAASATKDLSRVFTPWSHVVALIYQQLTKTESLNGVCDAARLHASQWQELRGAVPPRRNTFSNANQHRDPTMMETLYWKMLDYLGGLSPEFVSIRNPSVLARFKKRHIHLLDSSTIQLVLNSIDWARHRARKAAAKLHMNYLPGNLLPSFAIVEDAGHHDSKRAEAVTANLGDGDILVADRAYTDFGFLNALALRNVFFVVREKTNLVMEALEALQDPVEFDADSKATQILGDEIVRPSRKGTAGKYTAGDGTLRRVTAMVEARGQMRRMVFFTNNRDWSARTVAELYRARWAVELFFKELKQTCQLRDFVGYNENAVKWQIWTGLLVHLLLRYLKFLSKWKLSFSRLAGVVRAGVWVRRGIVRLLEMYGTAGGWKSGGAKPKPLYLQGFLPFSLSPMGQHLAKS